MRTIPATLAPTALESPDLIMPSDELPPGPTQQLRRAMARFRDGTPHTTARAAVTTVIDQIGPADVAAAATLRTCALIAAGRRDDVTAVVPVVAVAEALGVLDPADDGERLVALVARVGDAVVAGSVTDIEEIDRATAELTSTVEPHGDAVALISILHQTRGATGALIEALLRAGDSRPAAVADTKRTARRDVEVGSFGVVTAGETVAVGLDLGTEFGHGRHACPGRELAEAITTAVLTELAVR